MPGGDAVTWLGGILIVAIVTQVISAFLNSPKEFAREFRQAVESLREDHAELHERYARHDERIGTLTKSIEDFRKETAAFSQQVSELKAAIGGLNHATRRRT